MAAILSDLQNQIVRQPLDQRIFLRGIAGAGKTTAAVARLIHLLKHGVAGDSILVLAPQRTLLQPYVEALNQHRLRSRGEVNFATIGGIARRMVELFWPLVAAEAGFADPKAPPIFLNLETTQYFMARLVKPLLEEGFFSSINMDRNRLYSQLADNLNKAAIVGFPHHQIGQRLKAAWIGEPGMLRVYDDVQYCVSLFREFCLQNNLLDFSLQVETFVKFVWTSPLCRNYILAKFRYIIADNIEEDTSVTHDLLSAWVSECDSALLIYDENGGYRRFLGANPDTALQLRDQCNVHFELNETHVMSDSIRHLHDAFSSTVQKKPIPKHTKEGMNAEVAWTFEMHRFFPAMLDWVCREIEKLIKEQHCLPGEIAILSPYLSDSLRFSIMTRLEQMNIPVRSHRPSRALRDEPVVQCLLTLSLLAHPNWLEINPSLIPDPFDVAYALMQAIEHLDPVRAQLLTSIVYRERGAIPWLSSFSQITGEMQERITYRVGTKYETIRNWILEYQSNPVSELDYFLSLLFGEILSQPGFGFHSNYQAGEITANLIESIQRFRWVTARIPDKLLKPTGLEYIEMVRQGVIAAQYLRSWETWSEDAVFVAPAYTFLMYNRPVDYQFWLDPGSRGWSERLYQPLTQPYVLSRNWKPDQVWTDLDEVQVSEESLFRLVTGLLRRCRKKLYLGLSDINEQGYEQRGALLHVLQKVFQEMI